MAVSKGVQTTEFALTAVINVSGLIGVLSGHVSPTTFIIIVGAINAVYSILRTLVKIFDPSYSIPPLPDISIPSGTTTTALVIPTVK